MESSSVNEIIARYTKRNVNSKRNFRDIKEKQQAMPRNGTEYKILNKHQEKMQADKND